MGRSTARELMRAAQAAEIEKNYPRAAALLKEAAQLRIDAGELGRAVPLLRHGLRLAPDDAELVKALEAAEAGSAPSDETPRRMHLELPQRGPTVADPALDSWCSFCCRPKDEVGAMVSGPAGAFICAACIRGAAALVGDAPLVGAAPLGFEPSPELAAAAAEPRLAFDQPAAAPRVQPTDFIEAAVLLARALGWSLDEVRSLSAEERARALEVLDGLGVRFGG